MKTQTQLKICAYIISLLGFWAVTLTDYFSSAWPVAAIIVVCAGWFFENLPARSAAIRMIWVGLSICMILFFPLEVIFSGSLLLPAVHVSMFGQTYLIFNPKNLKVYRRIFAISFAQLLASAILTTDLAFAVILIAYCFTGVYGIMLLQILSGLQNSCETSAASPTDSKESYGMFLSSLIWTLMLLPFTLGFFLGGPRLDYGLISASDEVEVLNQVRRERTRTGFTKTVQLGTFGRIQEDQTLALRVEIPEGSKKLKNTLRWRGGALNIYNETAWSSSRDRFAYYTGKEWMMSNKNFGIIFPRKNNLFIMDSQYAQYSSEEQLDSDPRLIKQVCYLEIPYSDRIFGAGEIKAIRGPFKYGIQQDFNRSLNIRNRQGLPEFISYTVYSEINDPTATELTQISYEEYKKLFNNKNYGHYVQIHFLQLPANLNPQIRQLTLEITKDAPTPYDKINKIKEFLETAFKYSLDPSKHAAEDPLSDFLLVNREGHCEYFATAMTLMSRIVGIPARLANGFQQGEWNDTGGFYEVRQRDAHAWVEIYFPGPGWVAFDPSPRMAADDYFQSRGSPIARMLSKKLLTLQIGWRKHILGYSGLQRTRLFSEIKRYLFYSAPRTAAYTFGKLVGNVWNFVSRQPVLIMLFLFLLITALFIYRKSVFRLSRPGPIRLLRRGKAGIVFYERMLRLLEKRKIVKPAYVTSLEFLEHPILQRHPMFSEIETLTSIYYRVRFGKKKLTSDEASTIHDILKRLKRSPDNLFLQAKEG